MVTKINIVAAFRGMHVSPAKHSSGGVTDGRTDRRTGRRTDRQTTDKVIPMCRYASQATQKYFFPHAWRSLLSIRFIAVASWPGEVLWRRRHSMTFLPRPGSIPIWIWLKSLIPAKFCKQSSSGSVVKRSICPLLASRARCNVLLWNTPEIW